MMSSMVMTPRSTPSSSMTGMTLRSYFAIRRATSSWSVSGVTLMMLVRMISQSFCEDRRSRREQLAQARRRSALERLVVRVA